MSDRDKLRPTHLQRQAWLYIRQSSMTQVRENVESREAQYELAARAEALGWRAEDVHVVDDDLGQSGAGVVGRSGFQSLVAAVGLGEVGLILGKEVSRLARDNATWYQLLDLCAMTDTLIADSDGLYHPGDHNDRLLLGMKGTISEAELFLLRSRLNGGLHHKAAKGELRQGLPVGLDYDEDGRVVMSADEAVREAISTVYRRFGELGSARQVLLSMVADNLAVPRRSTGERRVRWAKPTYPAIHDFLTNPAYAGAFVFGRRKLKRRVGENGQVVTSSVDLPIEEWEVCIPGHHPGYCDWETYLANRDKLRANWNGAGPGSGAPREGTALLQGLVRCGRCGRKMRVGYSGNGSGPRYVCVQGLILYGLVRTCQSIGGRKLDAAVVDEVFRLLEPAAVAATAAALSEAETHHAGRLRTFELAVERASFEAERARRQFDAVEPENRLVARSLERDWEKKLSVLRQAESDLAAQASRRPPMLSPEEAAWLARSGADLQAIFTADTTTKRERKQLLRLIVTDVVVTVERETGRAEVRVIFEGGACTTLEIKLPRRGADNARRTEEETVELIGRLAEHYSDATIARMLARRGRPTATGLPFTARHVAAIRHHAGIPSHQLQAKRAGDSGKAAETLTVAEATGLLGASKSTLHRWLASGFIAGEQLFPGAPWRVKVDAALRARITSEAPPGWVGLAEAARALGVARQTVLDRVRRGELNAVHVNRGRRKGLAIEVPPPSQSLF